MDQVRFFPTKPEMGTPPTELKPFQHNRKWEYCQWIKALFQQHNGNYNTANGIRHFFQHNRSTNIAIGTSGTLFKQNRKR